MKFCKYCGTELEGQEKFCKKCGQVLSQGDDFKKKEVEMPLAKEKECDFVDEVAIKEEKPTLTENKAIPVEEPKRVVNEEKISPKINSNKSKNKMIGVIAALLILAIGVVGFIVKDSLLYNYHKKQGDNEKITLNKLISYDKALKFKAGEEVKNSIFEEIKNNMSFFEDVDKMENLDKKSKDDIKLKVILYNVEKEYKDKEYASAERLLNQASNFGYNQKDHLLYDSIKSKVEEEESYQSGINNYNPNIYDTYKNYGYIIEDSSSRYLNEYELYKYSKEELALIRNEIYARHGYVFTKEPYKSYFEAKQWYTQDANFKGNDIELNDYEIKNVALIKGLEG